MDQNVVIDRSENADSKPPYAGYIENTTVTQKHNPNICGREQRRKNKTAAFHNINEFNDI